MLQVGCRKICEYTDLRNMKVKVIDFSCNNRFWENGGSGNNFFVVIVVVVYVLLF